MDDLISRQAAIDTLDGIFDNVPMELTTEILRLRRELRELPSANVVGKADIMALLEETEKELVKGTDEKSIARCFIVSIMGIVKCKIMQMGEKIDG